MHVNHDAAPALNYHWLGFGLRIKGVQGHAGVCEMTWADDGRATFSAGASIVAGEPHIIWRRVGSHDILQNP